MKKTQALLASALICGALTAVAQPASATTIDLTLQSLQFNYTSTPGFTGAAPHFLDDGVWDFTSNDNWVETVDLPYTFHFSGTNPAIPPGPLFVVQPQNSSSHIAEGIIGVTFNFTYNSLNYALNENVAYYANASTDIDTLTWQSGSNGTCTGTHTYDSCTYSFMIGTQGFSIDMDNETDWDMAEYDAASAALPPATNVPEPASVTLLGAGLLGFGMFIRRRKVSAKA